MARIVLFLADTTPRAIKVKFLLLILLMGLAGMINYLESTNGY